MTKDSAIGWMVIIGFFWVVGANQRPEPSKPDPDMYKPNIHADKPIKVGDTTYANEKELIDAVCKATPGLKGCP